MLVLEGRRVFIITVFLFLTTCFISIELTYGDNNNVTSTSDISTYEFIINSGNVIQPNDFAGVHETYPIEGYFQLCIDFDEGND